MKSLFSINIGKGIFALVLALTFKRMFVSLNLEVIPSVHPVTGGHNICSFRGTCMDVNTTIDIYIYIYITDINVLIFCFVLNETACFGLCNIFRCSINVQLSLLNFFLPKMNQYL
jgi:hypothetical protein